jgi:hypothetical protein
MAGRLMPFGEWPKDLPPKEPRTYIAGLFPDKTCAFGYCSSHVKPAVTVLPMRAVSPAVVPVVTKVQTTL